jgi:hypothetical protein
MAILNYTTKIDAFKTVGEIQSILVKHGAMNVSVDFDQAQPVSLTFLVQLNGELINFRLPCNFMGVHRALTKDASVPKSLKTQEQARRVAWRILKDWVESQMAIVESELATLPEVFLPYIVMPTGLTLYESVNQHGLKSLKGGQD